MEKIVIEIVVDNIKLHPIAMGLGEQHLIYKDDIMFFSMGHVFNREGTEVPYDYTINLTRHKTEKELGKE